MGDSSLTIIGTLCSSTIILIIWGIFRKWSKDLLKLISVSWILNWFGYLAFDLLKPQFGDISIEFQVSRSIFIMIFYAFLAIILAECFNWSKMVLFQESIVIFMALIGYLIIIAFSPTVYYALMAIGIILPIIYWPAKTRMGL